MIHATTQRDLADILRDFDPEHTVAEAIIFLGNVSGFWMCFDYDPQNLSIDFQAFVDRKYDELEAYIDTHITDAPIEDDEIKDILYAWVYSQRVLINEGVKKIVKANADRYEEEQRNESLSSGETDEPSTFIGDHGETMVETAEIETSAQSDKQPNDLERDNTEIKAQEEALKIRTADEHSVEPEDLNNLAEIYYKQGKYDEAEPLYVQALAINEINLGFDHPDTEKVREKLETLRNENARIRTAEGPHVEAADLDSLAAFYEENGRYEEAERLYRRALEIREKSFGSQVAFSSVLIFGSLSSDTSLTISAILSPKSSLRPL